MKRIICMLLALAMLAGCAQSAEPTESSVTETVVETGVAEETTEESTQLSGQWSEELTALFWRKAC